jgi:hypothetical protein
VSIGHYVPGAESRSTGESLIYWQATNNSTQIVAKDAALPIGEKGSTPLLSRKPEIGRDIKNSRRLSFYKFLNTTTKHNSLDSRSHEPAKCIVGAALAANARSGNREQKKTQVHVFTKRRGRTE